MQHLEDAVLLQISPHRLRCRQHARVCKARADVWVLLRSDNSIDMSFTSGGAYKQSHQPAATQQ